MRWTRLALEIVTPEAVAYSADVNMVTLPAVVDGQIGVFPHHVRLLTQVVPERSSCASTAATPISRSAKGWCSSPADRYRS
jgi:F0F1-type ATP synthase epsilon subunit